MAIKLGVEHRHIGILLGIEPHYIDAIDADNRKTVDRGFEVLKRWMYALKERSSIKSYKQLCDALKDLGRNDLVDFVRERKH